MNTVELPINIEGFVTIRDLGTGEIIYEGKNLIHKENMSQIIAQSFARGSNSFISEMHFGCGAAVITDSGPIVYRKPNVTGIEADLYTPTYFRIVDESDNNQPSESMDNVVVIHVVGENYSNTIITATLTSTDPTAEPTDMFNLVDISAGILAGTIIAGEFEFNEIGLKTRGDSGPNTGKLLSHFIFHPVIKTADQTIQIVYTLRIKAG